jgi:hypothetical protein
LAGVDPREYLADVLPQPTGRIRLMDLPALRRYIRPGSDGRATRVRSASGRCLGYCAVQGDPPSIRVAWRMVSLDWLSWR